MAPDPPAPGATPPLVSCIMPTRDRRRWVPLAIEYFRRQRYPARELIVVDDGDDAVRDVVPDDPAIRYLRIPAGQSLGAKRNLACEAARGEIVAHWDDDDWSAGWRLDYQVAQLQAAGAEACGLATLLFYDAPASQAWWYRYPGGRPWVAGATLCYLREHWRRHPFPALDVGEDTRFVWAMRPGSLLALSDPSFYVAMLHPGNTSSRPSASTRWQPAPADAALSLLGDDAVRYGGATPPVLAPAGRPAARVTVSIPCFGAARYLRRAVESVLAQTHAELRVVVVDDGAAEPPWPALAGIDDPRLLRFGLPRNRGRYFADAVVLAATADPYFAVQDADDWSEPGRIGALLRLLRAEHAVAALSSSQQHRPDGDGTRRLRLESYAARLRPLDERFAHRANHHGLFRTDALRAVGGTFGGFRVGYDTLLVNLLLMTGHVAYTDEPLYHRLIHPASLTNAPETGLRSDTRRRAAQRLAALYAEAYAAYGELVAGTADTARLGASIRALARRHVRAEDEAALAAEAARLKAMLREQDAVLAGRATARPLRARASPSAPRPHSVSPRERAGSGGAWTMPEPVLARLAERLEAIGPARLLEVGSGRSTLVLAAHVARRGGSLLTLEHDAGHHRRTARLLEDAGLAAHAELRLAPLRCGPDGLAWYDTALEGRFRFVLVDGPPERHGRGGVLPALAGRLARGWELWLNDGHRAHELECLERWSADASFEATLLEIDGHAVWRLRARAADGGATGGIDPARVGVTLLTGGRPRLLRRSVEALRRLAPGLLAGGAVAVLVNGDDAESRGYVDALDFVDVRLDHAGGFLPTGEAASRLVRAVLDHTPVDFVLHLEDDWVAESCEAEWLGRAAALLDASPELGQVRLRHAGEPVLAHHMVTRRPIRWEPRGAARVTASAHFTFNPSLVRAAEARRVFACASEPEAQRRFLATGLGSAQLLPGVFRHIGESASLRRKLGR